MLLKAQLQPSCHAWWQWPGWDMFEDDIVGSKHPGPCVAIRPNRKTSIEKRMIITWNDRSKLAISWTTWRIMMHDASWCMIRNDLCLTCSIFRGYCRLSKAIQVYPRHQQMHGEAPRHQSEETNCGIIRCINSHSNRSWTARNSQEWLDSLPFWYRFWDTLKWSNDQTARHMMIPYAIESNIPSSTFLSSWWKWGRIASGHSSTEKTKKNSCKRGETQA